MTTNLNTDTSTETPASGASATRRAAARRRRRDSNAVPAGLRAAGSPQRSALLRLPFVIALIAVLGVGVSGVLYFNTKIDESGIRTEQAKTTVAQLRLKIESLDKSIAQMRSTPQLAERARALGLVPAGDAAILELDGPDSHGVGDDASGSADGDGEARNAGTADADTGGTDSGRKSGEEGDAAVRTNLEGATVIGKPHAASGTSDTGADQ